MQNLRVALARLFRSEYGCGVAYFSSLFLLFIILLLVFCEEGKEKIFFLENSVTENVDQFGSNGTKSDCKFQLKRQLTTSGVV